MGGGGVSLHGRINGRSLKNTVDGTAADERKVLDVIADEGRVILR